MTSTYCDRAVRDDLPDGIYEWFRQLTGFEFRWNIGVISDHTPDDFDLVYDRSHSIPVVYAPEQEDMSYIHERVKAYVSARPRRLRFRGEDLAMRCRGRFAGCMHIWEFMWYYKFT